MIKTQAEDPHNLNEVTDPVFSPSCSVRGIKVKLSIIDLLEIRMKSINASITFICFILLILFLSSALHY